VDAVIMGGYWGSGRNGGTVSEFLLGLPETGGGVAGYTKWCSFCRVRGGIGLVWWVGALASNV
jgi:DNA ligase-4